MIKQLFYLTFFLISFIGFSQCDINIDQGPMIDDPDGSYNLQIIDGNISLAPFAAGYDTLTAFPNAMTGELYETIVGIRIPVDTSLVYDLGSGPQLFENVAINTIAINDVVGIPMGFSWECVPENCTWTGGQYGCIRFFSDSPIDPMLTGIYPLNVLLDVDATYEAFGLAIPVTLTVEDLLDYYVLVIEESQGSSIGEVISVNDFGFIGTFPNPTKDNFIIQYNNNGIEKIDVKIYDILGNVVLINRYVSTMGYNEILFDSSKLVSGIYTLSLSNNIESIMDRIIIE